jgi:hypothetical protein
MTLGIEPATFRPVAQYLNQLRAVCDFSAVLNLCTYRAPLGAVISFVGFLTTLSVSRLYSVVWYDDDQVETIWKEKIMA